VQLSFQHEKGHFNFVRNKKERGRRGRRGRQLAREIGGFVKLRTFFISLMSFFGGSQPDFSHIKQIFQEKGATKKYAYI